MCFSEVASFGAGGLLLISSFPCIKEAIKTKKEYIPLATTPLFFGLQQIIEGLVWTGINANNTFLTYNASVAFLFFALFFWPWWIPITALFIEKNKKRKQILFILCCFGFGFGLFLWFPVLLNSQVGGLINTDVCSSSICYIRQEHLLPPKFRGLIYVTLGFSFLLVSKNKIFKIFWSSTMSFAIITKITHAYAFISVWCFLAALSSFLIWGLLRNLALKKNA